MRMKKLYLGLLVTIVLVLGLSSKSHAYGENDIEDDGRLNNVDYFYSNSGGLGDLFLSENLLSNIGSKDTPVFSVEKANNYTGNKGERHKGMLEIGELQPYTLDGFQHFKSITSFISDSGYVVDARPLENSTNLKNLTLQQPLYSLDFLTNLVNLESLSIEASNLVNLDENYAIDDGTYGEKRDSSLSVFTDLTMLDNLNKLSSFDMYNDGRKFPEIVLKKQMKKYTMVNPFILSKQFDGSSKEITSNYSNFSYTEDLLSWNDLTPDVKELPISWKFEKGNFVYQGESVIPIHWID